MVQLYSSQKGNKSNCCISLRPTSGIPTPSHDLLPATCEWSNYVHHCDLSKKSFISLRLRYCIKQILKKLKNWIYFKTGVFDKCGYKIKLRKTINGATIC